MGEPVWELPGDILTELMKLNGCKDIADFDEKHQLRASEKINSHKGKEREKLLEKLDVLVPSYGKWWNRFQITWDSAPGPWRASFTDHDLDVLVFAGWFNEGDSIHQRMLAAIHLQNKIKLAHMTRKQILAMEKPKGRIRLDRVFDALSYALLDGLRESPLGQNYPFEDITRLASTLSRNGLRALSALGICDIREDDLRNPPDIGGTRGSANPRTVPEDTADMDALMYRYVYEWARQIVDEELEELARRVGE